MFEQDQTASSGGKKRKRRNRCSEGQAESCCSFGLNHRQAAEGKWRRQTSRDVRAQSRWQPESLTFSKGHRFAGWDVKHGIVMLHAPLQEKNKQTHMKKFSLIDSKHWPDREQNSQWKPFFFLVNPRGKLGGGWRQCGCHKKKKPCAREAANEISANVQQRSRGSVTATQPGALGGRGGRRLTKEIKEKRSIKNEWRDWRSFGSNHVWHLNVRGRQQLLPHKYPQIAGVNLNH